MSPPATATSKHRFQVSWRVLPRYLPSDLLLLIYFIALVRQWFWPFEDRLAWIITFPVAFGFWIFYVSTKENDNQGPSKWFWLVVGLPLFFAYVLRFPFPDTSFDVWSLRLFHGERALHGFLYRPTEFFPTSAPFNPTPDMITGLFRHALGYRLGTVVNLLALVWAATILDKMLQPIVNEGRLRAICVLLIVFIEHLLFEINNYMPDLLALPVLLEATRLTLETQNDLNRRRILQVAFLIGVAITIKLSNGAVAMPLVVIWIWRLLRAKPIQARFLATTAVLSLLVTVPLLLPFTIWVYKLTGSPIFPLYNGVFRSALYPPFNGWDDRWGGYGPFEIFSWPVLMFFHPERTAELAVYTGRLSVAYIVSMVCLVFARKLESKSRQLAFIIFLGSLLWSLTMGYIRYGLLLEVLSGALLINIAAVAYRKLTSKVGRTAVILVIASLVIGQSTVAASYLLRMEWSLRPTAFDDFKAYRSQTRNILHDYSLRSTLPLHERDLFDQVGVWIVSGAKTSGPMILLNGKPPFIGVRSAGLFLAPATREVFSRSLNTFTDKRLFSLALHTDFGDSVYALRQAGLGVGHVENVSIPFFSEHDDLLQASFFEVTREFTGSASPERTSATSIFSAEDLRADLVPLNAPQLLKPGEILDLYVRVKNGGLHKWPSLADRDNKYRVLLAGRWLSSNRVAGSQENVPLPYDLPPGESVVALIRLRVPADPGEYTLEFDITEQGVGGVVATESTPSRTTVYVRP